VIVYAPKYTPSHVSLNMLCLQASGDTGDKDPKQLGSGHVIARQEKISEVISLPCYMSIHFMYASSQVNIHSSTLVPCKSLK